MSTIPFETILGIIALEIADAEKALGDAKCAEDTLAAHLCGRVSGLLDILDRLSGLQDPSLGGRVGRRGAPRGHHQGQAGGRRRRREEGSDEEDRRAPRQGGALRPPHELSMN